MQDKHDEDSKELRDQVDDLENRIKLEQLNSQKAINEIEGQHEVQITKHKSEIKELEKNMSLLKNSHESDKQRI